MPLTVAPDPANPDKWIWIDSATGQPATQPGGPGTPYVAPSDVPAAANIDPNASRPPAAPTTPGTNQPAVPPVQGINNDQVDQITAQARQSLADARSQVSATWDQYQTVQDQYTKLLQSGNTAQIDIQGPQLTSQLNTLYSKQAQAQNNLADASNAYANVLNSALQKVTLDPALASKYQAEADLAQKQGAQAQATTDVLLNGADTQRQYVAAQAAQANAAAQRDAALADSTRATTDAQRQVLANQAAQYGAQANQINQLLPGLLDKQQADLTLSQHQVSLTDAQSDYYQANAAEAGARGNLQNAQANLLVPAQAALQTAQAGTEQAKQQQALLGPMYGLQDQLNAIRTIQNQVFGPGGSGSADDANKLLQDYVTATVSGTTPYAASVAAANYGQNIFGTQASMYNAAQSALASRANALAGLGGNVLGTLGQMNVNAPAGSTALAGAFRDVMNFAAGQQQQAQDAFAKSMGFTGGAGGLQQPTAPALPAFLQQFGPAAAPTGAPAPPSGGGQTTAPVTINIGGQGQGQAQAPAPVPSGPPGGYAPPAAQPGTYGALTGSMPALLQKNMPLSPQEATDYWHQINGVQPPSSS